MHQFCFLAGIKAIRPCFSSKTIKTVGIHSSGHGHLVSLVGNCPCIPSVCSVCASDQHRQMVLGGCSKALGGTRVAF